MGAEIIDTSKLFKGKPSIPGTPFNPTALDDPSADAAVGGAAYNPRYTSPSSSSGRSDPSADIPTASNSNQANATGRTTPDGVS